MKLNSYMPRINSKSFEEAREIMERVRLMMVDEYGLDKKVIVDNSMGYWGYIIPFGKSGEYNFSDIYIKTAGATLKAVIDAIIHEFVHIQYPDCHRSHSRKLTDEEKRQERMHKIENERLLKKVLEKLNIN